MSNFDFGTTVSTLAKAIVQQVNKGASVAKLFRSAVQDAQGAGQTTAQIVELLSAVRRESTAQIDQTVAKLAKKGQDGGDIRRAFTHASTYAAKVAGTELGVKLVWDRKADEFKVEELKAAGETGKPTASTKGQPKKDAAEQSADIVALAQAPTFADLLKADGLEKSARAMVEAFGLEKVQAAIHAEALRLAQIAAADAAAEKAKAPKAPAIAKAKAAGKAPATVMASAMAKAKARKTA